MINPQEFAEFMEMYQAFKLFKQMEQPNPDPVQSSALVIPNQQQIMAQSNAAATASVQEVNDLKSQIEALKSQLAAAQSELSSTKSELSTTKSQLASSQAQVKILTEKTSNLSDIGKEAEKLEQLTGKSISEITEKISKNEKVIPRSGKGAHDVFKEMIDAGKLSHEDVVYADSEDVLDAIEDSQSSTLSPKELLAQKQKELENQGIIDFRDKNSMNEFGF